MKLTALVIALFVLSFPHFVFAEEGSTSTTETKKDRMEAKKDVLMEKKEARVDAVTTKLADKKEAREQKLETLKEKLATLKDQQKAVVAERLDGKLEMINKNRTDRLTEKVTKLSEILAKLEALKIEAETNGKNVSSVTTAIAAAETAITAAETAIEAQAAKEYTAKVTSETTLKQNFGSVFSQLSADLKATHQKVVDAKGAVKAAAKALRLIEGEAGVSGTPAVSAAPTI